MNYFKKGKLRLAIFYIKTYRPIPVDLAMALLEEGYDVEHLENKYRR